MLELINFFICLFLSPKDDPFLPGGGITAPCLNLGRLFCLVQLLNVQCITWPVSQHTHYQAHFVVHCCKPCIQKDKKTKQKNSCTLTVTTIITAVCMGSGDVLLTCVRRGQQNSIQVQLLSCCSVSYYCKTIRQSLFFNINWGYHYCLATLLVEGFGFFFCSFFFFTFAFLFCSVCKCTVDLTDALCKWPCPVKKITPLHIQTQNGHC